jgi:pyruvate dehydrogenase E2 component (dihydrolipoamide acetyltransferase)
MGIEIIMPKIGLTMTEGKILEWRKREGEWVEKGEILFVFETEKVAFEVEAQQSGFLVKILAQKDETVPVGKVVGLLAQDKGEQLELTAERPHEIQDDTGERSSEERVGGGDKIRATPMAKRIAKEHGLNLKNIPGSGSGGRIRVSDVEAALEKKSSGEALPAAGEGKLVKLSGMREIIAKKMLAAKIETAQTYMTVSVDASKIVESRDKLVPIVDKMVGVRLTINDIIMKITAVAISRHPVINTRWTPDGIVWLDTIHMGMAMALDEGLIVPVIWDITKRSLSEIARARSEIVQKGKAGKLTPDDMKGSTFTVSSLGMFGIEEFTANINLPETAILAVGAILDKPVVVNKELVIRPMMKLTLSYDHRVIDGAKAAQFLNTLRELMEDPILILS